MRISRIAGFTFAVVSAMGIASCTFSPTLPCEGVSTSFEFTDTTGEFTLEEGTTTVTFSGGLAQRVGNLSLYRTGLFAWMIPAGETGTIRFDPPIQDVSLFLKDQLDSNASVLTVLDAGGSVMATFDGTTSFAEIRISIDPSFDSAVASITLTNNGSSGFTVIDDFQTCVPGSDVVGDDDGGDDGSTNGEPLDDPIPDAISKGDVRVRLVPLADGLVAPNWGIAAPGHPNHLFVVDQVGTLWAVSLESGELSEVLDLSSRLVSLGIAGPESFDERGFLGVAFHPDFASNGLLYTYTSEPVVSDPDFSTMPEGATANHQSVITEWQVTDPTVPDSSVDVASARELLRIDQPQFNHNGGALNFGPDGMLYIALGDGGGADDGDGQDFQGGPMVGHGLNGNGQDATNPLGALLRIDPLGSNSANGRYGVPSDNPFVGSDDSADAVDEIFAFGFRNPFRFSFDSLTGDLYLADVGQNDIEEINVVTSGGNYGWNWKEGSLLFDPNGNDDGFVTAVGPGVPAGLIDPVAEYDHDEGVAVVGGFVYRGADIAALTGQYVFGEFARTFNNDGRLFYLDDSGEIREFQLVDQDELGISLLGFAQDAMGRIYVLGNSTGTPFSGTGVVLRIGPEN